MSRASTPFRIQDVRQALEDLFVPTRIESLDDDYPLKVLYETAKVWEDTPNLPFWKEDFSDEAGKFGVAMLDVLTLMKLWAPSVGAISQLDQSSFGCEAFVNETLSRLKAADQYYGRILELWTAATMGADGTTLIPITEPSMPDFRAEGSDGSFLAYVECKNNDHWDYEKIQEDLRKANSQIKLAQENQPGPGIVVIGLLGSRNLWFAGQESSDRRDLVEGCNTLLRRFGGKNFTSTSRVYLVWDEVITCDDSQRSIAAASVLRRVMPLENWNATRPIKTNQCVLRPFVVNSEIGGANLSTISNYNHRPLVNRELTQEDQTRFLAAAANLDRFTADRTSCSTEIIYSSGRRKTADGNLIDVLVLTRTGERAEILWGRSFPESIFSNGVVPDDPKELFKLILERFGRKVRIGDRVSKHIERIVVPVSQKDKKINVMKVIGAGGLSFREIGAMLRLSLWGLVNRDSGIPPDNVMMSIDLACAINRRLLADAGSIEFGAENS